MIFNVMADVDKLEAMSQAFASMNVQDMFESTDWNVWVPDDEDDSLCDYCEKHGITCQLV